MSWFALAIVCMVFSSFKSVLAKKLLNGFEPTMFSFFDQFCTMLFVLPFLHRRDLASLDGDFWLMLAATVVPAMLGVVYLSKATKHGQMSDVTPLLIFLPVFIALSGPLWNEDGVTSHAWAGIITVGCGGYFLNLEGWRRPFDPLLRILRDRAARYVWITILLGVWTTQLQKWMVLAYDSGTALFFSTLGVFICLIPLTLRHAGGVKKLGQAAGGSWRMLLVLGVVSSVSAWSQFGAYDYGGDVATVLSIKRLSVIFVCFYGFSVLNERMNTGKIIGIALMILGGAMLYYA